MINIINHKELTRDLLVQLMACGTVTGIWMGSKKEPYLHIFDNVKMAFPAYRKQGRWIVAVDLAYFTQLTEIQRRREFANLSPYVTNEQYEKYQQKTDNENNRYIELPIERSIALRTHTVKRNQRFGMAWGAQSLFDLQHKRTMKNVETVVANQIINSVGTVTIGNQDYPNLKLKKIIKKRVFSGIKNALESSPTSGIKVISMPEWVNLEFPKINSDALESNKFETVNNDIEQGTGISSGLKGSGTGTYSGNQNNLEMLMKKVSVELENIEFEVYKKLLNLILPAKYSKFLTICYDKELPLDSKEIMTNLMKLQQQGFNLKAVIEKLGFNYKEFIDQTLDEQETQDYPARITPYQSSATLSKDGGRPSEGITDSSDTNIIKDNQ